MASSRPGVRPLHILERLFLVIAVVSLGWYATAHILSAREQGSLSRELDQAIKPENFDQLARTTTTSTTSTTTDTAPAKVGASARGLVGRIDVPRLRLSVLAREGIDGKTLRVAAGHIPGTALPGDAGNAGFAAHRDTFFRPLKSVREGDAVVVTTARGVYRYAVTDTRIVEPGDVSVLDSTTDAILTLVTCYPFEYIGNAPQRFIVRAALRER
jgi:LPXTG-site transpeptidase (sortase) family protein